MVVVNRESFVSEASVETQGGTNMNASTEILTYTYLRKATNSTLHVVFDAQATIVRGLKTLWTVELIINSVRMRKDFQVLQEYRNNASTNLQCFPISASAPLDRFSSTVRLLVKLQFPEGSVNDEPRMQFNSSNLSIMEIAS